MRVTVTSDLLAKGPRQIKTLRFIGNREIEEAEEKRLLLDKPAGFVVNEAKPVSGLVSWVLLTHSKA